MFVAGLYDRFLGHNANEKLRHMCIQTAILGFLLHLLLCLLYQLDLISFSQQTSGLFDSYLDALYTPFSIFLAYEVYELIRTIPCLLYTSPSPRDRQKSRMPSSA